MEKEEQTDAIALRKLRELKGFSRKDAAIVLELGYKSIEKFENGRTTLNRTRIDKILMSYGYSHEDFLLCREGRVDKVKNKVGHKKVKVLNNNLSRRSYKKVITKEVKVLQVLRKLKGLTQYQASAYCGYSKSAIGHIEHGRVEVETSCVIHIVESYGYTMKDFKYHLNSEVFVTDIQDDCINIIKKLSEEKLKAVYPLLSTFK